MPDLFSKYPLGYLIDPETGRFIPGIGGGTVEPGEAAVETGAAEAGGAAGEAGEAGGETPPGGEGGAGGVVQEPFLSVSEQELLGDKNIKSKADLVKSSVHAGAHIKTLERERVEDRQLLSDARAELEALKAGGATSQPPPNRSQEPEVYDPEYQALWNEGKFEEATNLKARKIAEKIVDQRLAAVTQKTQDQFDDQAHRVRMTEARGAVEKMSADATKYPGFVDALPYMRKYIDENTERHGAWQSGFADTQKMFEAAYAHVAFQFPNLINPGRGREASAAGGGVGAGSRGPGGAGGQKKPPAKIDPKIWQDLGLTPNPWQNKLSALDQKAQDKLDQEAAGAESGATA